MVLVFPTATADCRCIGLRLPHLVPCFQVLTQQTELLELNLPIFVAVHIVIQALNLVVCQFYLELLNTELEISECEEPFLFKQLQTEITH